MADDELRGKTCQSVMEDDRVCGKPAAVKEFGCYFCAEHASASTEAEQDLQTIDSTKGSKGLTSQEAPLQKRASKTVPNIMETVSQEAPVEGGPGKTAPLPEPPKAPKKPKLQEDAEPKTEKEPPVAPKTPVDDGDEAGVVKTKFEKKTPKAKTPPEATPQVIVEPPAPAEPTATPTPAAPAEAVAPAVDAEAKPEPPVEQTPVEPLEPVPATVMAPAQTAPAPPPETMPLPESKPQPETKSQPDTAVPATQVKAPKPAIPAEVPATAAKTAAVSGNTFADFAQAVQQRLPSASSAEIEIAKGPSMLETLTEIEHDLLDLTARSFRIWEKVRALQPDKEELELQKFHIKRYYIDLSAKQVRSEIAPCKDLEDVMGGIARGLKILEERPTDDPYDPAATLVMNLGILSGTQFMTGLRTFFHAYSPLKTSRSGKPSAMWSAGSGKFGAKLRFLDVEEVLFEGRCGGPTMLHISRPDPQGPPIFKFEDASFLSGRRVNDKIQTLHHRFPDAHFAVLGPAGEAYKQVRYAAIALSTENQLKSGDAKSRFCSRGGMGGVMGSKNLLAIVADVPDPPMGEMPPELKAINDEVARGKGSAKYRDKEKGGQGGTWSNYEVLNPIHALPEMNFVPTGTDASVALQRDKVEAEGRFIVKDEGCYQCEINCHKNVYNMGRDQKPGRFRAKLDFGPLNLLSSNIGIFDVDDACELIALVDEMGMDSISCGVTLAYAMEYNRRHAGNGKKIADGLEFGDFEGARRAIENIGLGRMEELGQGCKRLSEQLGDTDYAVHVKGMELPPYLPQFNPGYPWALADGQSSMRTGMLYVHEKETSVDYWVDAILNRGIQSLRDDFLGVCKFANLDDQTMCTAVHILTGLELTVEQMQKVIRRTFLRGYRLERRQGFTDDDYVLPKMAHEKYDQIQLPHFNTPEFFQELKDRILETIDRMLVDEGMQG